MLRRKTVIVTGVGVGLGRECVTSALREGANVVHGGAHAGEPRCDVAELDPAGERVAARATDITDPDACAALVQLGHRSGSAASTR